MGFQKKLKLKLKVLRLKKTELIKRKMADVAAVDVLQCYSL